MTAAEIEAMDKINAATADAMKGVPSKEELFPGMLSERASWYYGQLKICSLDGFMQAEALFWWNDQMNERQRAFVCRLARTERVYEKDSWLVIPPPDRARLMCRWMWLLEMGAELHPPMSRYLPRVFV